MRVKAPLLILALSGRMLAHSASRAGYDPLVVDLYADLDTQAVARVWRLGGDDDQAGFDAATLLETAMNLIDRHRPVGWLYGSGVDRLPEVIEVLAERCPLYGNSADSAKLCVRPRLFFPLLDDLSIPYPDICWESPPDSDWVVKDGGEGGRGVGIASGTERHSGAYFQRRLRGPVYTLAFLSGGGKLQWFSFNRLYTTAYNKQLPFLFAGAINRVSLAPAVKECVVNATRRLCEALNLKGWHGLDFMLDGYGRPKVLELNPRPGATLALWDEPERGGVDAHIRVCQGNRPRSRLTSPVKAFRIVYAAAPVRIPAGWRWPGWCADVPAPGVTIVSGEPVCSVMAVGDDVAQVEACLQSRMAWIDQWLMEHTTAEVDESWRKR